jgi:hypothetical protein
MGSLGYKKNWSVFVLTIFLNSVAENKTGKAMSLALLALSFCCHARQNRKILISKVIK